MATTDERLDLLAHALADPTRRRIVERLTASPGQTTGQLSGAAPQLTRFAVMKHVDVLRRAGLLRTMNEGRRRRHFPEVGGLAALRAWLDGLPGA
jgi:DNA-binding transcriptional ArsR family regulator